MAKTIKALKKSGLETWSSQDIYRYSVIAISKGLHPPKKYKKTRILDVITKQKIGMAIVENVPSQITKSQICQIFSHFYNVTSVLILNDGDLTNNDRFCWVGVINPVDTLNQLSNIAIAGEKLQIRLMGYLYPDQGEN